MALKDLLVRISADPTEFTKAMNDAGKRITDFGEGAKKMGDGLTKWVTGPIAAVATGAGAAAWSVADLSGGFVDLATRTGLSITQLQDYGQVAMSVGIDSGALANASIKLSTGLSGTGQESKILTESMGRLGIQFRDTQGELVPMDQLFPQVISKLAAMEDVTTRNALAGDIFGRSWVELGPVLDLGADGIGEMIQRAHDLGLVMSEEAILEADKFGETMDLVNAQVAAAKNELGMAFLPVLTDLVQLLQSDVIPAVRGVVKWYTELSPPMQKAIQVTALVAAGLGPVISGFGQVAVALGTVLPLFGTSLPAVFKVVTPFLGPAGLIAGGLIALVAVWLKWGDDIKRIVSDTINAVKSWFTGPFGEAVDGIRQKTEAVTGFFARMYDVVVGNSIVPDMITEVGGHFARLDGEMVQPTVRAVTESIGAFERFKDRLRVQQEEQAATLRQMREDFILLGGTLEEVSARGTAAIDTLGTSTGGLSGILSKVVDTLSDGKGGGILGALTGGASSGGIGGVLKGIGSSILGKVGLGALGGPAGILGSVAASVAGPLVGKAIDGVKDIGKSVVSSIGSFFGIGGGDKKKKKEEEAKRQAAADALAQQEAAAAYAQLTAAQPLTSPSAWGIGSSPAIPSGGQPIMIEFTMNIAGNLIGDRTHADEVVEYLFAGISRRLGVETMTTHQRTGSAFAR